MTLTGAGGCGKTRLALESASSLVGCSPDGVWLTELAALTDPSLVPQTVAAALELPEDQQRSPTERVVERLRPRSTLLLIDNCEHLIEACARLADALLSRCPHLRLLATSRQALGLTG